MGLFHVRGDVEMSTESYGEGVVDEPHPEEVGTCDVGTDGTIEMFGTQ